MSIADSFAKIKNECGPKTTLIAVSKTRSIEEVEIVKALGQTDFGENKVQELLFKSTSPKLQGARWHFIGHLQSNKINQLLSVDNLVSIHSIDRLSLLTKLLNKRPSQKISLFLQVNTSGEDEKGGFSLKNEEEISRAIDQVKQSEFYELAGLMTIGKIRTDNFEKDAKDCFKALVDLKHKLDKDHSLNLKLSMGMSQDFKIAIEMGSDYVRIGSQIFGPRV